MVDQILHLLIALAIALFHDARHDPSDQIVAVKCLLFRGHLFEVVSRWGWHVWLLLSTFDQEPGPPIRAEIAEAALLVAVRPHPLADTTLPSLAGW